MAKGDQTIDCEQTGRLVDIVLRLSDTDKKALLMQMEKEHPSLKRQYKRPILSYRTEDIDWSDRESYGQLY